ncbi:Di-copper centre-containing protein [Fusarium austroafricanum]|uniref:tyrosinase n=1 Tax=Fusarium austroafricanum TaxID=2364996 RepID=A0A8H4K856_9HYPO|nr:Di-copper centre-containing protein [Fusarium austroafricanum]
MVPTIPSPTPITGVQNPGGKPSQRLPVDIFQKDQPFAFALYIQALLAWQENGNGEFDKDNVNGTSYFQVVGVHGVPYVPWQNDPTAGTQIIYSYAEEIANKATGYAAEAYKEALLRVRLPYWDWAKKPNLPDVVMSPDITLTVPGKSKGVNATKYLEHNPLYSYKFTSPSAIKLLQQEMNWENTDAWTESKRCPDATDFDQFTSKAWRPDGSPHTYTSVEDMHNNIHNYIGTNDTILNDEEEIEITKLMGNMTDVQASSFDPVFWLHHVNCDRLTALWEALNPDCTIAEYPSLLPRYVAVTGIMEGGESSLEPWHQTAQHDMSDYYIANDTKELTSTFKGGYYYPETPLEYIADKQAMKTYTTKQINILYGPKKKRAVPPPPKGGFQDVKPPVAANPGPATRYWQVFLRVKNFALTGTWAIHVFLGELPESTAGWFLSENRVGSVTLLSNRSIRQCANCVSQAENDILVTGTVPLNEALEERAVDVDNVDAVVDYLKRELSWRAVKDTQNVKLTDDLGLTVGVSAQTVSMPDSASKIFSAVKNKDQILKETDDDIKIMRMNLIALDKLAHRAEKSKVQFHVGLGPEDIRAVLSSAEKTFSSPILFGIQLMERRRGSWPELDEAALDHVLALNNSIYRLENSLSEVQNKPDDLKSLGWTQQTVMDSVRDSRQLVDLARKAIVATTTATEPGQSHTRARNRKRNRDAYRQCADETHRSQSVVSQSSVYNSVSQARATMSRLGEPLSNSERQDVADWRDNVLTNGAQTGGTSHLKSGSLDHSEQIASVSPPSQKKKQELIQKTLHSIPASPVEPRNVHCEPNTIVKAATHLISPDFEDMYIHIAQAFKNRMGHNKTVQWTKDTKQQLLRGTNTRESTALGGGDTWMLFEAVFRTKTDSSVKATLNPFISSPLLNEVRFNEGKKLYQRGNLVTAAPLLILFANNERQRGEISGIYQRKTHACRPETEKSLLCGKLLCQLDPFSSRAPESLYCSGCKDKSVWPSSWPWLPQFFAFLSLDKYSRTARGLDNDFYSSAKSAVLQFFSVMDRMAEDTVGTLAVASAVMHFLVRQGKATFDTNNIPLGLHLTWTGTLPYFRSQQKSMLVLAKSSSEQAADMGLELLRKHYRRISFAQELKDRQDPPVLYERIRSMLIKNGGKLWGSEGPRYRDSPTRYPVIELLATCTPRLQ